MCQTKKLSNFSPVQLQVLEEVKELILYCKTNIHRSGTPYFERCKLKALLIMKDNIWIRNFLFYNVP